MPMRVTGILWLLACVAGLLTGCSSSSEKKEETSQSRLFARAPSLVEMAVMESGAISNPKRVENEDGNPVDFIGHNGRRIRVDHIPEQGKTKVIVSHMGFGGPEGARRALDVIEDWMAQTDAVRNKPVPKPAPEPLIPLPTTRGNTR